jgi:AraC-like DNA-binding protein
MILANYEYKSEPISLQKPTPALSPLPHLHKELELIYVEKGSTLAYADQNVYTVNEGELYISFPNQIHYYKNSNDSLFRVLIVTPDMFYGLKDTFYANIPENNKITLGKNDPIKTFIENIYSVEEKEGLTRFVGLFNLLMAELLPRLKLLPAISTDHATLRTILEFCSSHYTEDLSLDYVATALHLSRCYISHLFSKKLSLGFNDYINMFRIREACYLLLNTDRKIADISEDVGFGSIRSFNRAFMKLIGKTPAQYRNM